ncbi:MAG: hypothetical protein OXH05_14425 [Acidobacteria bacterium]|nr:hypothetical protein [Acidobacteriota bacterium]
MRPSASRGTPGLFSVRSGRFLVLAVLVGALGSLSCDARLYLYIHGGREALFPGRAYGDALVTQGFLASVPPGRGLPPGEPPRRFVLRHPLRPPDWNGTLVIGAHRGLGGIRRGLEGEDLGSGETELDDLIGWWALDQGFAWASFDRAGVGAGPDGYRLTEAFARLMFDQIRPRLAMDPDRTILLGYGEGGGLARYGAAAADETFDGVVLVAATLGDPEGASRRRSARLALAADRETSDAGLAAYAAAAGIGLEGSRFWPFYDAVAAAPSPVLPAPPVGLEHPVIEVVGTLDDFVLPEVLAYRDRIQAAGMTGVHELRLVPGAWGVGPGDDAVEELQAWAAELGLSEADRAALASGRSLAPEVQRALRDLNARLQDSPR